MTQGSTIYGGTNVGDYSGAHLKGAYGITDKLWIDGGLWQRKITYRGDNESITSWQAALQYRLNDISANSAYAIRLSTWGDHSSELNKASPTNVQGITVNSLSVKSPNDVQLQIDLIGTWPFRHDYDFSAFAGLGTSRVSIGEMSANYTSGNGCNYNLDFTSSGVTGAVVAPCTAPLAVSTFSTPTSIMSEMEYDSSYVQAGGMLRWHKRGWHLAGGYQYQYLRRSNVDQLISNAGRTPYKSNSVFVGEISRDLSKNSSLFVRGQVMSNQFVGEIPFIYNSATASKFSGKYGFASFGMRYTF